MIIFLAETNDILCEMRPFLQSKWVFGEKNKRNCSQNSFVYVRKIITQQVYCLKVSKSIVVLFNGGVKSAQTAQNSPDLANEFKEAQFFAKQIIKAFKNKKLLINPENRTIVDCNGLSIIRII